jgi:hypothetical protein
LLAYLVVYYYIPPSKIINSQLFELNLVYVCFILAESIFVTTIKLRNCAKN